MPTVCGHNEHQYSPSFLLNLFSFTIAWAHYRFCRFSNPQHFHARIFERLVLIGTISFFADISIDCIVQMMNFMTKTLSKAPILLTLEKSCTVSNLSSIRTVSMKSISHSTSHSQHYFEFMVVSMAYKHKVIPCNAISLIFGMMDLTNERLSQSRISLSDKSGFQDL